MNSPKNPTMRGFIFDVDVEQLLSLDDEWVPHIILVKTIFGYYPFF
jgi:hypothetical protein